MVAFCLYTLSIDHQLFYWSNGPSFRLCTSLNIIILCSLYIFVSWFKTLYNLHSCAFQSGIFVMKAMVASLQLVNDTFAWDSLTDMVPLLNTLLISMAVAVACYPVFYYETQTQTNHKCIWLISSVLKLLTCLRSNVFIYWYSWIELMWSRYFQFGMKFQLLIVKYDWQLHFCLTGSFKRILWRPIKYTLCLYLLAIKCQKLINKILFTQLRQRTFAGLTFS